MKIFCVISNYGEGELGEPEWYTLPDSTMLRSDNPFFVPEFDSEFVGIPTLAVRINRLGKSVAPRFASRYYDEATIAVCVVAKNLLNALKASGKPWSRAVAFDRSCLMGDFIDKSVLFEAGKAEIGCGAGKMVYDFGQIHESVDGIVAMVSRDNTLKTGDLVLVALAPQGLPFAIGDTLSVTARIAESGTRELLTIRIR